MLCSDACGALTLQLLVYGLTNGAAIVLSAVGFTLAYAVARQINLAHGNVFALTTVAVASLAGTLGVPATASLVTRCLALLLLALVGAGCGALLNVLVERLAFRPFRRRRDPLGPLIATVGLSFVFLQLAVWWRVLVPPARGNAPNPHHGSIDVPLLSMPELVPAVELGWGCVSFTLKDACVLLFGIVVAAGATALLAQTKIGRLLRAVAQDPELAALCGADPGRATMLAFALAGALTGLGAAIFAAYYGGVYAQHGLRSGLAAMTAAVLGGVGSPPGAVAGGLVLGVITAFSDYLLDAYWTPALILLLLVGLLAFRPTGLLASEPAPSSENVPPSGALPAPSHVLHPPRWLLAGVFGLAVVYPWVDQLSGWYRVHSVTLALLMVTLAVGLNIVVSFAGLLDLGYAAFFALGAYTAAILTSSSSQLGAMLPSPARDPWLALVAAGPLAAGFGLAFGLPSVRTRGEYLAIVTLAFGEIVPNVIWHLPSWTGGPRGMSGIASPRLLPWVSSSPPQVYLVALAAATLACLAASRLAASRTGRAWAAVRDDEVAAGAVGVNPVHAKLLAFAIGAGYAGVAGAIYAGLLGSILPEQFDFTVSLMVLAAVVVGGRWGIGGAVLGALLITAYDRGLVYAANGALHLLGTATGVSALLTADLRGDNWAVFGLALYLATVARTSEAG